MGMTSLPLMGIRNIPEKDIVDNKKETSLPLMGIRNARCISRSCSRRRFHYPSWGSETGSTAGY